MVCANIDNPFLDSTCTSDGIVCAPSCSLDAVTCEPVDYPASIVVMSTLAASGADIGSIPGTVYPSTIAWTDPQNAVSQNGLFATAVIPYNAQSNWLVAIGLGLSIPSTATILGIRPVFRGKTDIGTDGTNFFASYLFDCLLTVGGNYFVLNGDLAVPFPGRVLADDALTVQYVGANIHFGCSDSGKPGCGWTNDVGWMDGLNWWNYTCRNISNWAPDPPPIDVTFNPTKQLWLRPWTSAELNDPTFGVGMLVGNSLIGTGPASLTAYVDCMGVAVYYVDGGTTPTGNPFQSFC